MADNCYHYDLKETGQCPGCGVVVTITSRYRSQVKFAGSTDTVSVEFPGRPSVRAVIATVLGVAENSITVVDVIPAGRYESATTVSFSLVGSRGVAVMTVVIDGYEYLDRDPLRVDMDAAAETASA